LGHGAKLGGLAFLEQPRQCCRQHDDRNHGTQPARGAFLTDNGATPGPFILIALRQHLTNLRSSFWFLPGLIVLGMVLLALGLIQADPWVGKEFFDDWPRLFGGGSDGARGLLSVIASSMISVTGIVFSITLVALTLTSSQYTPRVLRNFMRDRLNQTVLGVFVGIFAYAMVVLRTIRSADEGLFVPSLAVLVGLLLGLVGIGFLVFYIHHIAVSIQAAQILAAVHDETREAIDRLFSDRLQDEAAEVDEPDAAAWHPVKASHTGYVQQVELNTLLAFAEEHDTVIRLQRGIGEFVIEGMAVLLVAGAEAPDRDTGRKLGTMVMVDRQRTVEQDVAFGIRQLVDIALKGLSPGINDVTTTVMSVDYLTAILARLGERRIDCHRTDRHGTPRVLGCGPDYSYLLGKAFEQIRQNADGNMAVLAHLLRSLRLLAGCTRDRQRREALVQHVRAVDEVCQRSIKAPVDREYLQSLADGVLATLDAAPHGQAS